MSAVTAIYVDGAFHPVEPVHLPENCEVHLQFEIQSPPVEATEAVCGDVSIEDKLAALAGQAPSDEWERLPADLSDQVDHYVYGTHRG